MHYKFNILYNVILIDVCTHSLTHSFIRLLIHSIICLSVLPSILPSFIQPPPIFLITSVNLLLTDQHNLGVSYVTYQLTGYFLLSLRCLIEDTLYNIPHPSSYILVESKASKPLVTFLKF